MKFTITYRYFLLKLLSNFYLLFHITFIFSYCKDISYLHQGVRSHGNVGESLRFNKNYLQIYVPIRPRMYEKNLIHLLKTSIPDISTNMSTIVFSVETLKKLCEFMLWRLLRISQFLKTDEHFYPFAEYLVFSSKHFLAEMLRLHLGKERLLCVNSK